MENKNQLNNFKDAPIDKGTILIVFILIMFSSKIWIITFDIIKSLLYLIIIIYFINYLNPEIASNIKNGINNFYMIDSENNIFRLTLSKISEFIMNIINPVFKKEEEEVFKINDNFEEFSTHDDDNDYDDMQHIISHNKLKLLENKNIFNNVNCGYTNNKIF
jgi:hypothetical protein